MIHSDLDEQTSVSTLEKFDTTKTNKNHVYTYIQTYMKKRKKEEKTESTNLVFYNFDSFKILQEIARRNNTNASSIISNFVDFFIRYFDEKPNTLDPYLDPDYVATPSILDHPEEKMLPFLRKQDTAMLQALADSAYHLHVWTTVLTKMTSEQRKTVTSDYRYVYNTFYH